MDTAPSSPLAYLASLPTSLPPVAGGYGWPTMSGREGWLVVLVGLLIVFGALPIWSFASAPMGGAWWSLTSFLVWSPWWRMEEKIGFVDSSINKPGDRPDQEVSCLFLRISPCCRGGGRGDKQELRARLRRPDKATRSWSISSVAVVARRWRLPEFSFFWERIHGDRWPAFAAPSPLTFRIE